MWIQRPVTESLLGIGVFLGIGAMLSGRCQRPAPRSAAVRVGDFAPKVDRAGSPGQLRPLVATAWIRNPRRIVSADVPGLRRLNHCSTSDRRILWNRRWKSAVFSPAPESVWITRIASIWSGAP